MGLRFVFGRGGSGKSTYLLNEIKQRVQDNETTPVILLVPEQYSFEMEKKISSLYLGKEKDKYMRTRVLTFNTMSALVFTKTGGLTDVNINSSGKAMITYKAIEKVASELNVFSKAAAQTGFVGSVSEIISELKQYNVNYDMLEYIAEDIENETLRLKLKDVSKIYEAFENELHENYVDSQDMLGSLAQKLENTSYFDECYVYIDEFTGFTPKQYSILAKLLKKAKEVSISLTVDNVNYLNYRKNDPFSRTKYTYEKLRKIAMDNGVKINPYIDLNKGKIKRFENNNELLHLERYYNAYPYHDYEKKVNYLKIKEFNNLYEEVEHIAKEIVNLVRDKNIRYKDITVATRDLNRYDFLVHSIFNEYEIPNFIDKKRDVKSNPIIVLITSALEIKNKRYSYEVMFRYLKSGLIGLSVDEVSLIENYVILNGIKGKKWLEEKWEYRAVNNYNSDITEEESQTIQTINEIKNRVLSPVIKLQNKLKGKKSCREICKNIYEFLVEIDMEQTIYDLVEDFKAKGELEVASQYSQVWDIVIDILDQIVEIMGDDVVSIDRFIKIISLGFEEYELGLVPPSIDQVLVSSVDRMKNPNTKYLYLIGVTDGIFPLIAKEKGILNDKDRNTLMDRGVEIDIDSKTKTFEEQFLVYKALTSTSENLILTYPVADSEGRSLRPSIIISRVKKIFPKLEVESYLLENKRENEEEMMDDITVKSPTFNKMVNKIKSFDNGEEIENLWLDVYRYFANDNKYREITRKIISGLTYTNMVHKVSQEKINKLYETHNLSVSKLEKYSACPFAYFIQYGLKAQERKEYSFAAPDLGTFIHNIMYEFSKSLEKDGLHWNQINEAYIDKKVNSIVDFMVLQIPGFILNSSPRYKYLSYRLKKMLMAAINIIAKQIKSGEFEPIDYEVNFGQTGKYPPIRIILEDGTQINLIGQIDRIDEFDEGDDRYIRIIDYKSSDKNVNLTEVYYGLQLQLLVYLDAIIESAMKKGTSIHPAAILYCKIDNPIAKFSENKDEEQIDEEILKQSKMKGLLAKDAHIIKKMDKALYEEDVKSSLIVPAGLNKDGSLSKSTNSVTYQEFEILRKYVKHEIKDLCEGMLGGDISISPNKHKDRTSCDFCIYNSICQFDPTLKDNNYNIIKDKKNEEIIQMMAEEVE